MKNSKWFERIYEGQQIESLVYYHLDRKYKYFQGGIHFEKSGLNIYISITIFRWKPEISISTENEYLEKWNNLTRTYNYQKKSLDKEVKNRKEIQDELKRLVSLLSGNTYQEGDNMMEAIEAFQQTKYLKEHAQDFLTIMTQNAPEVAAQELFEYFEIEVPDSTNIEIETAKKLYDLWIRAQEEILAQRGQKPEKFYKYEELAIQTKKKLLEEVYKLWNR